MQRVILIHWNETEGKARAQMLEDFGYNVTLFTGGPPNSLRETTPHAIVIDLTRLPSQGRDFGVQVRQQKENRRVPLVFAGGLADKVERVKASLPDATYTPWEDIRPALEQAIANPPADPVVPGTFDSYAGTPLHQKLGIRPGNLVFLHNAPPNAEQTIGELPQGAQLTIVPNVKAEVALLFVQSVADLPGGFATAINSLASSGKLWILWPKKAAKVKTDLSHDIVQRYGLDQGWMDYKIVKFDDIWSGLCFTSKKS